MKEKIKLWYEQGLWTKEMIQDAMKRYPSLLTEQDYLEIVQERDVP